MSMNKPTHQQSQVMSHTVIDYEEEIVLSESVIDHEHKIISDAVEDIKILKHEYNIKMEQYNVTIHKEKIAILANRANIDKQRCNIKLQNMMRKMQDVRDKANRKGDRTTKQLKHEMNIIETNQSHIDIHCSDGYVKKMVTDSVLKCIGKSPTPLLTVSKLFLLNHHMWENSIILSNMKQVKATNECKASVHYGGTPLIGMKLKDISLSEGIHISKIPGQ